MGALHSERENAGSGSDLPGSCYSYPGVFLWQKYRASANSKMSYLIRQRPEL